MEKLGEKLAAVMLKAEMSAQDLSVKIGVDNSQIHRWIKGTGHPTPMRLLWLAREFGVTIEWLISDDPQDHRLAGELTADERFVLRGYREAVAKHGLTPTQAVVRMDSPLASPTPPKK